MAIKILKASIVFGLGLAALALAAGQNNPAASKKPADNPAKPLVRKDLLVFGKGVIAHHSMELRPEVYRRDGDFVFVLGADIVQDTPESPKVLRRFTNVWRREHGAWRLFVRHANLAPGGPPAGGAPEDPETRR